MTIRQLLLARQADPRINRVINIKQIEQRLNRQQLQLESRNTRALLRKWDKLEFSNDGLLHRRTNNHLQLVLSAAKRSLVYRELHQEMGHLGVDCEIRLARERFFWLRMHDEITHFMIKVCCCFKQRRPQSQPHAQMQHLT